VVRLLLLAATDTQRGHCLQELWHRNADITGDELDLESLHRHWG